MFSIFSAVWAMFVPLKGPFLHVLSPLSCPTLAQLRPGGSPLGLIYLKTEVLAGSLLCSLMVTGNWGNMHEFLTNMAGGAGVVTQNGLLRLESTAHNLRQRPADIYLNLSTNTMVAWEQENFQER